MPLALVIALLAACASPARRPATSEAGSVPAAIVSRSSAEATRGAVEIYVIKRRWHTDVGFEVKDLRPPLSSLRAAFPAARYLLFGFGDRHYLLSGGRSFELLGALWPGPGLVLVTSLEGSPEAAFGASDVIWLAVGAAQERSLEHFVWETLAHPSGAAVPLASGPYGGSRYYASEQRYSALHTCNTWTAEALHAAGLPVSSAGVEFAGQVWTHVRLLKRQRSAQ